MNLKITLLKLLPLITFITLLLPTPKIARAASSAPAKEVAPTQKLLTEESSDETYISAAPKSDKGFGESTDLKTIVLSRKAKKIEFIVLASLMGLGVFAPEIFFKKNKEVSNSEDYSDIEQEEVKAKKPEKTVEPDLDFLKVISEKTKDVDFFSEKSAGSNGKVVNKTNSKSA